MRWLVISLAAHALVVFLLVGRDDHAVVTQLPTRAIETAAPAVTETAIEIDFAPSGGSPSAAQSPAARAVRIGSTKARSANAWSGLSIRSESREDGRGTGNGNGNGVGNGNGIGFGNGAGVQVARDVPAPPPPPAVSKARPAKLIWPNRDLDVEDETYLFIAKVTVDEEGSVVGARMLTSRPGSRADQAANAIWTFRYAPALDDAGKPIRSSFEQPFQVR